MEKTISVEEKIRRAEEIYMRRQGMKNAKVPNQNESISSEKKDLKLLKKMIIQIIVCLVIYGVIYVLQNNQLFFSKDFITRVNEILSYDTNFLQMYEVMKNKIMEFQNNVKVDLKKQDKENSEEKTEEKDEEKAKESKAENDGIGGAVETIETKEKTQEEKDIESVKNASSFIKPINGKITSKYGYRETATGRVPKNHTGVDIANVVGTKIISATDGEVVLASEEGDYGKHLKIQLGELSVIYAHCNKLYVKHGDVVKQGQEIAEVGSTGNSTGPHLHFEIRYQERTVNPENILEL